MKPLDAGLVSRWRLVQSASVDSHLSRTDLAVLIAVLDRMNDQGVCWPGLGRIASDTGAARSSAVRSVKRLTDRGYLLRESGGRRAAETNRYRMGECAPTSSCEAAPRSGAAPRCNPVLGVDASSRPHVGANLRPELASGNLSHEPVSETRAAPRPIDLLGDAQKFLVAAGTKPESADKAIGKLRRVVGQDEALEVIGQLLATRPTSPNSYIWGVIRSREKPPRSMGVVPRDCRTNEEQRLANEAAFARMSGGSM